MNILNRRGNVLLFVISGIAMAAAIGMGMFYMTSTTSMGQMTGNAMDRAHYLAVAGKNYALANWEDRTSWNNVEFSVSDKEEFIISYSGDEITSTGIVNKDTALEARKEIKAKSPSPIFAKKEWKDTFEDLTNWATGSGAGALGSQEISADKSLDVTDVTSAGFGTGTGKWSFLQLLAGAGYAVNLTKAWQDAGYCLSHDLQVKIKNDESLYFAGITFKIEGTGVNRTFYGISFLRARQGKLSWSDTWRQIDDIPLGIAPEGIFLDPPVDYWGGWYQVRTSRPTIVLWKKGGAGFTWLAYKILDSSNYVVTDSYGLQAWSNIQVRLIEAYPLNFTNGGPTPLLYGTIIVGAASGAKARINGTPVLSAEDETWSSSNASGTLTLDSISGTFQSGENLLVNGQICAKASGTLGSKANYIRVYYGDVSDHTPSNDNPTDDNRKSNPRLTTGVTDHVHWPVDDVSYWSADNDYLTLVQWAETNSSATKLGGVGTREANAIIKDSSLLTPNSGTIDYSDIALHATGDTATSTYFDDFAIQY